MNNKRKLREDEYVPTFRRPCRRCDEYFLPRGKFTKICDKCQLKKLRKAWRGYG